MLKIKSYKQVNYQPSEVEGTSILESHHETASVFLNWTIEHRLFVFPTHVDLKIDRYTVIIIYRMDVKMTS